MTPHEIWDCELWEFNACMLGFSDRKKSEAAANIMTGFYAAYYTNGGKKAKQPQELIDRLYQKPQSLDEGLRSIEQIKKLEKQGG